MAPQFHAAAAYRDSEVLITGGLGFLGSNLALALERAGAHVLVVDSLIPEYGGNLFNLNSQKGNIQVNISDVRDRHSLQYLVQHKDYLFNLAGQTSHLDSMENPFTDLEINCHAQLSIMETCRLHNPGIRIIFASTRQVYGKPLYLPVDENHPVHPVDVNGIHKVAAEAYHLLYSRVYGIKTCALRFTNAYGPRMRIKDERQTFLGLWIRRLLEGEPLEIYGDGSQQRDLTFVDDAVHALLVAGIHSDAVGQFFNVGGSETVSLKDLAELMIRIHGIGRARSIPFPEDRKRIDIGDYRADDTKLRNKLGWKPEVSLVNGMKKTLAYFRKNRGHYL